MKKVKIEEVQFNPINPRTITDSKYEKLKQSLIDFPEMLELRPLVVDEKGEVLGGNMRLKALLELGYKEVPIVQVNDLTEEQKKEFVIKDNLSFGEWDWDIIEAEDWKSLPLLDWGMDYIATDWDALSEFGEDIEPPTEKKIDKITILLEEDGVEDKAKILEEVKDLMKKWNNYVIK